MKNLTLFLAAAAMFASCQNINDVAGESSSAKQVTFTIKGDFTLTTSPMTRALSSEGKDMTDVWVFDYVDGKLKQQLHQTAENEDFGVPSLSLELGSHDLYFVASRCASPTLNTSAKTLTFGKVYDTFWRSLSLDITSGGNESRVVSLDRIVTKLRLVFTDAIPDGAASINITPGRWYYGFNYMTSAPVSQQDGETVTIAVPASIYGVEGQSASVYGFSSTTEWTTSLAITSLDTDDNIIGSVSIASAPFLRNRQTEYSGKFWTSNEGMTMTLNTEWLDSYEGSW